MSDYWEYQALAKMALEDGLELDHSMLGEGWIYQPNSRILIVREYDCCLCTLCFMSQYLPLTQEVRDQQCFLNLSCLYNQEEPLGIRRVLT